MEWPRWPIWSEEERQALSDVLESGNWWYGEKVCEHAVQAGRQAVLADRAVQGLLTE